MAHLGLRAVHAAVDHFLRIGRAILESLAQRLEAGRQDEDTNDVAASQLEQLLRTLPVDVEQNVLAVLEILEHGVARRAVALVEHARPFEELVVLRHRAEGFLVDEVIVLAVDLALAWRARRIRHRHLDAVALFLEQAVGNRGLARARRRGQHEHQPATLEVLGLGGAMIDHAR